MNAGYILSSCAQLIFPKLALVLKTSHNLDGIRMLLLKFFFGSESFEDAEYVKILEFVKLK